MLKIINVEKDSVGYEIGLEQGDIIKEFNGYPAQDILDYLYFNGEEEFSITVKCKGGETSTVYIEKEVDETLGLSFEDDNLKLKRCQNKCIFCFVDQMPKGMRKSLYVKPFIKKLRNRTWRKFFDFYGRNIWNSKQCDLGQSKNI